MTIQEYAASAIEKSTEDLIQAALTLPEDKWDWMPMGKGRSVLSQIAECAAHNTLDAKLVQAGAWQESLKDEWGPLVAALDTPQKALTALREGTLALTKAVRETPETALANEIALQETIITLAQLFLVSVWNMNYHEGQINYMETLGT